MLMSHKQNGATPEQLFGTLVRRSREALGLSQEELARDVTETGTPLHQTALARIEGGNRGIRFNEVVALSVRLSLDLKTNSFSPASQMSDEAIERTVAELETLRLKQFAAAQEVAKFDQRASQVEHERRRAIELAQALARAVEMTERRLEEALRWREAVLGKPEGPHDGER